jgi:hypothetical protein
VTTSPGAVDAEADKAALARIEQALSTIGAEDSPPVGWEARVLAARPPRRAPWWRWALAIPAVAAAVILLWRVFMVDGPPAVQLSMTVKSHGPLVRSAAAVSLGDSLTIQVRGAGERVLWVYREGRLLIACPGDARCQASPSISAGELLLTWTVQDLGSYAVVAAGSASALPAPSGDLDADLGALAGAGADHEVKRFDIR